MRPTTATGQTAVNAAGFRTVYPDAVLRWLGQGWQDLRQAGGISLMHGLLVSVISIAITAVTLLYWPLLPGAVTGFVIVGPFLATGLYYLSYRVEQGSIASCRGSFQAWKHGSRCLFVFGVLLVLAGSGWVLFSLVMFHFFIDVEINQPLDFLRYVLTQDDAVFMLWTILGALGAALAFAATVVSLPLLVERNISTGDAVLISVRAVGENPGTMVLWAMTILIITGLSFATLMLGFIVLYPLLGHASWHVYRDLIDAENLPLREEFSVHG